VRTQADARGGDELGHAVDVGVEPAEVEQEAGRVELARRETDVGPLGR
jgi:hypothetical protein